MAPCGTWCRTMQPVNTRSFSISCTRQMATLYTHCGMLIVGYAAVTVARRVATAGDTGTRPQCALPCPLVNFVHICVICEPRARGAVIHTIHLLIPMLVYTLFVCLLNFHSYFLPSLLLYFLLCSFCVAVYSVPAPESRK